MSGLVDGAIISGGVNFQRFTLTSESPWNKPAGVTKVYIEVIGAGGGGGGGHHPTSGDGQCVAGGGGGAFTRGMYPAESLPNTLAITVGTSASAAAVDNNGGAGNLSSVTGAGVDTAPGNSGSPTFSLYAYGGGGGGNLMVCKILALTFTSPCTVPLSLYMSAP